MTYSLNIQRLALRERGEAYQSVLHNSPIDCRPHLRSPR